MVERFATDTVVLSFLFSDDGNLAVGHELISDDPVVDLDDIECHFVVVVDGGKDLQFEDDLLEVDRGS